MRMPCLVALSLLVGCGGSHERGDAGRAPDASATDAGSSEDAGSTRDAGSTGDAGAATCAFADDLERGCGDDANCVVGVHQTDCCGNTSALGMNHSERDRFDAAESACRATYPLCGCPSGPTTTDSGETAFDVATIQVGCIASGPTRVCMTYVSARPPDTP